MKYILVLSMLYWNVCIASEPVMIEVEGGKLYGELLVPTENFTGKVALIIAGSGPTDRDGNSTIINGKNNSLKMLAEGLAENGIASLRYDKRGIGLSANALTSEAELTFDMSISDADNWVKLLAKDARFSHIYVVGHSQGALIACVLGEKNKQVDGVISVSGTALSAEQTIRNQLKGLPEGLDTEAEKILNELTQGRTVSQVTLFLENIFRPSVQPFLISWLKYSPKEVVAQIKIPLLIVHGTTDIQIPHWHADSIAKYNGDAKLYKISGMNHVLKDAPMQRTENIATYGNPDLKLSPGLVDGIAGFIKSY